MAGPNPDARSGGGCQQNLLTPNSGPSATFAAYGKGPGSVHPAYALPMLALGIRIGRQWYGIANLTAASRAAGVNRSTIVRALKSGRLSATTNDAGERCIDTTELMRVFGPLKADAQVDAQALPTHAIGDETLVEVLREQLHLSHEREQQAQLEKARLLAMLETEQQARRELEQCLLPAPASSLPTPKPTRPGTARLWILLAILLTAIVTAVVLHLKWVS